MENKELITSLSSPGFYPHRPCRVEHIQTHISHVFLAGDLVYKLKKPLDLGFLDFSSLEKRRFYCQEEIRLNRRLAPDTYLRVEAVIREGSGSLRLAPEETSGRAVDYCVVMKRLPRDRLLSSLLNKEAVDSAAMDSIAHRLVSFHRQSEADSGLSPERELEYIRRNLEENFSQTEAFVGALISQRALDKVRSFSRDRLRDKAELFRQRVEEQRIKEGHGDLRSEHICLLEQEIVIFDCIEFNERFRYLDVAAEVGFLAMDLDFLGHPGLARDFVSAYVDRSGDQAILELLQFYKCYYAYTRGKVAGIRSQESELQQQQKEAEDEAVRYFELAYAYALRPQRPLLLIMSGLMGSGKSRLAGELAFYLDAPLLRSDVLRKEMLGLDPESAHPESFGQGIYDPQITDRVYRELLERSREYLAQGRSVILDASFSRSKKRLQAWELARQTGAGFGVLECSCPEPELQRRLARRATKESDPSDGRPELLKEQAASFEPIEELSSRHHIRIDTSQELRHSLEQSLHQLQELLEASRPGGG